MFSKGWRSYDCDDYTSSSSSSLSAMTSLSSSPALSSSSSSFTTSSSSSSFRTSSSSSSVTILSSSSLTTSSSPPTLSSITFKTSSVFSTTTCAERHLLSYSGRSDSVEDYAFYRYKELRPAANLIEQYINNSATTNSTPINTNTSSSSSSKSSRKNAENHMWRNVVNSVLRICIVIFFFSVVILNLLCLSVLKDSYRNNSLNTKSLSAGFSRISASLTPLFTFSDSSSNSRRGSSRTRRQLPGAQRRLPEESTSGPPSSSCEEIVDKFMVLLEKTLGDPDDAPLNLLKDDYEELFKLNVKFRGRIAKTHLIIKQMNAELLNHQLHKSPKTAHKKTDPSSGTKGPTPVCKQDAALAAELKELKSSYSHLKLQYNKDKGRLEQLQKSEQKCKKVVGAVNTQTSHSQDTIEVIRVLDGNLTAAAEAVKAELVNAINAKFLSSITGGSRRLGADYGETDLFFSSDMLAVNGIIQRISYSGGNIEFIPDDYELVVGEYLGLDELATRRKLQALPVGAHNIQFIISDIPHNKDENQLSPALAAMLFKSLDQSHESGNASGSNDSGSNNGQCSYAGEICGAINQTNGKKVVGASPFMRGAMKPWIRVHSFDPHVIIIMVVPKDDSETIDIERIKDNIHSRIVDSRVPTFGIKKRTIAGNVDHKNSNNNIQLLFDKDRVIYMGHKEYCNSASEDICYYRSFGHSVHKPKADFPVSRNTRVVQIVLIGFLERAAEEVESKERGSSSQILLFAEDAFNRVGISLLSRDEENKDRKILYSSVLHKLDMGDETPLAIAEQYSIWIIVMCVGVALVLIAVLLGSVWFFKRCPCVFTPDKDTQADDEFEGYGECITTHNTVTTSATMEEKGVLSKLWTKSCSSIDNLIGKFLA